MTERTAPINFRADMQRIAEEIYDELDSYTQNAVVSHGDYRSRHWQPEYSSTEAYLGSVSPNRERLREILGDFDEWKLDLQPQIELLFEQTDCFAYRVSLAVLPGVRARGILLVPRAVEFPTAAVMVQHGYKSAPEDALGLHDPDSVYHAYGRRLVQRGFVVFAHKDLSFKEPRSRIHRIATLMGETLLGLEIYKTSRVVDYLTSLPEVAPTRIGMYGISQGGMMTLYAAALDQRIAASVVCAYFNERTSKMVVSGGDDYTAFIDTDEIDKDISGLLEFTDVELAALICPRPLLIEAGKDDGACYWPMVESEYRRVEEIYNRANVSDRLILHLHAGGHEINGEESFPFLENWLRPSRPHADVLDVDLTPIGDVEGAIEKSQAQTYEEMLAYFTDMNLGSGPQRARRWNREYDGLAAYERSVAPNRSHLRQLLGADSRDLVDLNSRSEEFATWDEATATRVTIDVLPGVTARGILLVPRHVEAPGPAVVAQHGMGGNPEHVLGLDPDDPFYHGYARKLAARGYVVFAHKLVSDRAERGRLHRKALLIGNSLLGLDMLKFERVVDYLQSIPEVDGDRIGMYGLSQGGLSTLYAAAADPRIKVAVCAAYFNERVPKMVVPDQKYASFLDTDEHDKFIHRHHLEFSDSDLASLICPRPFLVEAGRGDSAVYWPMLLNEFARVQEIYDRLGIPERAAVDLHDLGHEINGGPSFEFLERWL